MKKQNLLYIRYKIAINIINKLLVSQPFDRLFRSDKTISRFCLFRYLNFYIKRLIA